MKTHTPKEYLNYNLEKIIKLICKNLDDDKLIGDIWDIIEN